MMLALGKGVQTLHDTNGNHALLNGGVYTALTRLLHGAVTTNLSAFTEESVVGMKNTFGHRHANTPAGIRLDWGREMSSVW